MKFYVFRILTGSWRFSNLRDIGGDCDTWREAFDAASTLAASARVEVTA